ncbi:hypothetical protein C4K19_3624 [Pseudomonas chlororaphis subsp. aurantiaca]|nr:hypothetical protein C4K19_3624 [Pseudomonas chlororaphis subsp. aurantiaca]AZD61481.1 hypothetical protein C4K18_3510 [Pseudomonas chlororaphis subsp. aurantiaca]
MRWNGDVVVTLLTGEMVGRDGYSLTRNPVIEVSRLRTKKYPSRIPVIRCERTAGHRKIGQSIQ